MIQIKNITKLIFFLSKQILSQNEISPKWRFHNLCTIPSTFKEQFGRGGISKTLNLPIPPWVSDSSLWKTPLTTRSRKTKSLFQVPSHQFRNATAGGNQVSTMGIPPLAKDFFFFLSWRDFLFWFTFSVDS